MTTGVLLISKYNHNIRFGERLALLGQEHGSLLSQDNSIELPGNGIYERWNQPLVTRDYVQLRGYALE